MDKNYFCTTFLDLINKHFTPKRFSDIKFIEKLEHFSMPDISEINVHYMVNNIPFHFVIYQTDRDFENVDKNFINILYDDLFDTDKRIVYEVQNANIGYNIGINYILYDDNGVINIDKNKTDEYFSTEIFLNSNEFCLIPLETLIKLSEFKNILIEITTPIYHNKHNKIIKQEIVDVINFLHTNRK